jgi:hypothetical protein
MKIYNKISGTILALTFSASAYSATLVLDGGQLIGADGITFDGYTASVRFVEGTCAGLFDGCDAASDLAFGAVSNSLTEAVDLGAVANSALREQVFAANPIYDTNPQLTFGCEVGTISWCKIWTPVYPLLSGNVSAIQLQNRTADLANDVAVGQGIDPTGFDSSDWQQHVYASWTLTAVPLPAAGPLFLSAIGAFGLLGTRRRLS